MPIIASYCLCFGATPCQIMEVPNCHNFRVEVNNEWGDNYRCILCIVNCMPTARSWERQQWPVSFNHGRGHLPTNDIYNTKYTIMNLHNFKVYLQVKICKFKIMCTCLCHVSCSTYIISGIHHPWNPILCGWRKCLPSLCMVHHHGFLCGGALPLGVHVIHVSNFALL